MVSYNYIDNYNHKKSVIVKIKNYLSSTNLAKNTATTLNFLEAGDTDKFIILKNNEPKAVLMSIDAYESMEEEIEDLRLTALALSRIQNFDPGECISHEEMMKKYAG
jgi:antitoxin StbD